MVSFCGNFIVRRTHGSSFIKMAIHQPCLILNQDGLPLGRISWQRALCLQIIGKEIPGEGIRILKYYEDDIVMSAGGDFFPVPAVGITNRFIKRPRKINLKKRNLLVRDKRKCQYCGIIVTPKTATVDHVIPRSHFKVQSEAHTWENIVVACKPCNSKKGNRTPEQAGMKLLKQPKAPDPGMFFLHHPIPEEWKLYVQA